MCVCVGCVDGANQRDHHGQPSLFCSTAGTQGGEQQPITPLPSSYQTFQAEQQDQIRFCLLSSPHRCCFEQVNPTKQNQRERKPASFHEKSQSFSGEEFYGRINYKMLRKEINPSVTPWAFSDLLSYTVQDELFHLFLPS